jgi:hypothetical protein
MVFRGFPQFAKPLQKNAFSASRFSKDFRRFARVAARLLDTNPVSGVKPSYLHF